MTSTTVPSRPAPDPLEVDVLRQRIGDTVMRASQTRNHLLRLLQDVAGLDEALRVHDETGHTPVLCDTSGRDLIDILIADMAKHAGGHVASSRFMPGVPR